jgi:ubiquitin-conjugating enzyme E2 D/E
LQSYVALLQNPNPEEPLEPEIALVLKTDKAAFERTAREWTQKYTI